MASSAVDAGPVNPRRKALFAAVCSICAETGFSSAERAAVESLVEMLQSCLIEIARSSRAFCELSGRTEVLSGDVFVALIEMGINVESLWSFVKRPSRIALPTPGLQARSSTPKILQAGDKKPLPPHIPEHMVPFPRSTCLHPNTNSQAAQPLCRPVSAVSSYSLQAYGPAVPNSAASQGPGVRAARRGTVQEQSQRPPELVDNPYLRSVKMPRKRKR
ncbi:hypothetical protein MRX96_042783 [Rhipicephalus microplus]